MDDAQVERRLAAILVADIAGYSRLMAEDEAVTVAALKGHQAVILPMVDAHGGRIQDTAGDGILAEFRSVQQAVECALAIQRTMAERNATIPAARQMRFRIGINHGDVMSDGTRVYGDGLNIAARIQALAEAGGICVTALVREEVGARTSLAFEDLGNQRLKNIPRPVRVFRIPLDDQGAPETTPPVRPRGVPRAWRRPVLLGVLALVLVGSLGFGVRLARDRGQSVDRPRLSIAVLPFSNLSGDPDQEYFADGLTEDLTTDLAHIQDSFVIARNTAFTYKGKALDLKQVGRELGVRYLLQGSVRRLGDAVRINAQLVDAEKGGQLWADRFEGERTNLAALEDQVTAGLARALDVQLTEAESLRAQRIHPTNPDAMDFAIRGRAIMNMPRTRENTLEAQQLFEQALQLDAQLLPAVVGRAESHAYQAWYRWSASPAESLAQAKDEIAQVLSRAPHYARAHYVLGQILREEKQSEAAIHAFQTALNYDRNLVAAHAYIGNLKLRTGRTAELFAHVETAIRLSPRDPDMYIWFYWIGHAHTHLAHWDEAIEYCGKSVAFHPTWLAYVDLAAAYAWKGQEAEAHNAIVEFTKLKPNYTVKQWANAGFSDNPTFLKEYALITEGLRKAGLPEE
jgi:TolB-like protein/class 3 adenylate cyclase